MQKIEEASRKKDEQTSQFITATRDALEQKMGTVTEKREAYITDLKTKLKVSIHHFVVNVFFDYVFVGSHWKRRKDPAVHRTTDWRGAQRHRGKTEDRLHSERWKYQEDAGPSQGTCKFPTNHDQIFTKVKVW